MPAPTTSRDKVAKDLERYLSSHHRGGEAYDFNIKMRMINVPDEVRNKLTPSQIDDVFSAEAGIRLQDFITELKTEFPWIYQWGQEGRSGGWLTIEPDDAVLDDYGHVVDLRRAKARLKALEKIDYRVDSAKKAFKRDMESKEYWEDHLS